MDILIKSFNRPYYLDRCLQSIYAQVAGSDFTIKILDDGTPERYLERLLEKYPDIKIFKSEGYDRKANGNFSNTVPINLWIETARNATDYFVLLEDDFWLTKSIDLKLIESALKDNAVGFLKLFWLGNPKLISGEIVKKNGFFTVYTPQLYTRNPFLFRLIFRMNRFKIRKVMTSLGFYTKDRALAYYSVYSVAGVVFNKDYFLSLWKGHTQQIDEYLQIQNALKFWKEHRNIQFAHSNTEMAATGFQSSATNKSYEGVNLDVFALNTILNEAWLNHEWDVMEAFPKDLSEESIARILEKQTHPSAQKGEWKKWVMQFKAQFKSIGCNVE